LEELAASRSPDYRFMSLPMITRLRVKQAFNATLVASRRCEKFDSGELLMLVDGPASPSETRFVRINGLRPSRGVECHYTIESEELKEKTEIAKQGR
jgi:hypothetical protein